MVAQRSLQPELRDDGEEELDAAAGGLALRPAARTFYQRCGKRAFDLIAGSALALIATPIVALLALLVVITSGWPPFYRAQRIGKDGREFSMIKLRTMVRDAERALDEWREKNPELAREYEQNFKLKDDPRVTPLGRFLRRSSLDELPQLWNVVRGDMSLVGPRPYYLHELAETPDSLRVITSVRPGITGPWQVQGRNALHPRFRMRLDRVYTEDVNLLSDLAYLAKTIRPLVRADGL